MGMNILGLNTREATLIKPNTASQTYRINQAKVKADIQSGNVTFTEEELVKARNVMQTAAKQINGDAGIKSNLDYKDYAMMALAEKAVGDYAKEHFNEAQQQVIADAMNRLKEEISRVSGKKEYTKSVAGETAGVATIATNKELINQMKSLFEGVDLTDTKQVQGAMDKYRELLRPAYNAFEFEKNVDKNISDDISGFLQKLQKIQASEAGRGVNYTV